MTFLGYSLKFDLIMTMIIRLETLGETNMVQMAKIREKRGEEREERFNGDFSLSLVSIENPQLSILIRPTDVSRRGLGFIVKENLKKGGYFWLVINRHRFRVELAYCHNHLGIEGLFRGGLFLREADGDLREVCFMEGLLLDDEKVHHNQIPRPN